MLQHFIYFAGNLEESSSYIHIYNHTIWLTAFQAFASSDPNTDQYPSELQSRNATTNLVY